MIEIINRQRKHPLNRTRIRKLIKRLEEHTRLGETEITVVFVGLQAIRTLNRTFRKKDEPTDVLSFPIGARGADGKHYLGDIVISVPVAERQARENGHTLDREIEILVLHGFLHLIGHNHGRSLTDEEKALRKTFFGEGA
jgi:probable rRNA maturation factor